MNAKELREKTVDQLNEELQKLKKESFKVGDSVRIQECAPKSKSKRWEVLVN
jgi:small subunit ribosomal protein S17